MKVITGTQKQVLDFVIEYKRRHDMAPTVREIAKYMNVTTGAIQDHLFALEKKGRITRVHGKARTIRVVEIPAGQWITYRCQRCGHIVGTNRIPEPCTCGCKSFSEVSVG
jgi:DNA-binding MarR family transcriptional regulator